MKAEQVINTDRVKGLIEINNQNNTHPLHPPQPPPSLRLKLRSIPEPTTEEQPDGIHQKHIPLQVEKKAPYRTKLLVCMDSNQQYIDRRKFWTLKATTWKFCPGIDEAKALIHNQQFNDLEGIIISC